MFVCSWSLSSREGEVDSSVSFAFVFGLEEFYLSDLFQVSDVCSSVGLLVDADYFYDSEAG